MKTFGAALLSLTPIAILAVGIWLWCLATAPQKLRVRRLWNELNGSLETASRLSADLEASRAALTDAAQAWSQKERSLEAELVTLREHRPRIIVTFNPEPAEQGRCFHIHNHGDRGASNVAALINVPDTSFSLSISVEQLAADGPIDKAAKLSTSSGRWSSDQVKTDSVIIFLKSARQSAHRARSRAEHERVRAAREAGDDAAEHDTRTVVDGLAADILADINIQAGSDETVLFDVSYQNVEGTWEYRAPHVLTITARDEVRILRIGVEPEPIRIPLATGGAT